MTILYTMVIVGLLGLALHFQLYWIAGPWSCSICSFSGGSVGTDQTILDNRGLMSIFDVFFGSLPGFVCFIALLGVATLFYFVYRLYRPQRLRGTPRL